MSIESRIISATFYKAEEDNKEGEPVSIGGGYASDKVYRFGVKDGPCYNPDGSINYRSRYAPAWETKTTEAKKNPILDAQAGPDGVYRVEGEIDPGLIEYEALKRMGEDMQEEINKMIRGVWGIP